LSSKHSFTSKKLLYSTGLGIALILCFFKGFSQTASFTTKAIIGCAPFDDIFTNTSTGATSYAWDFGDGASSNSKDVSHTYGKPGIYKVTLMANGPVPSSTSVTVTVFDKPFVAFTTTTPNLGCKGLSVSFKDSSVNTGRAAIKTWEWTFGDGGLSVIQNPTYAYTSVQSGVIKYTVALTITDANGCRNSISKPEFVATSDRPQTSFSVNPNPATACSPPLTVVFTNTSSPGLSYLWDYGQGSKSTGKDSIIKYSANGNYSVLLTATNEYNCSGTAPYQVSINKPKANFAVLGTRDTVCKNMTFINKSSGGFPTWTYGDGTTGTALNHVYAKGGVYLVTLRTSAGNCFHDTSRSIVVEEPIADFASSPHYSCQAPVTVIFTDKSSNAVKWKWVFGNKKISLKQNPSNTYIQDTLEYGVNRRNVFTDSLYIISQHGCRDSIRKVKNDTLFQPNALFKLSVAQGCVPILVTFTDSSTSKEAIKNYAWDFGDGTSASGVSKQVTHTYANAGKYRARLIITNSLGCMDTSYQMTIMAGNTPQPDFSFSPASVCIKGTVQFTDLTPAANNIDSWHYTADGTYLSACPNDKNPGWAFDGDNIGNQNIVLTVGSMGCYASKTKTILVKGPRARANASMKCPKPFDYAFASDITGATSWTWDYGDGTALDNSNNPSPLHSYTKSGDVVVKLTATSSSSGCPAYTDQITVHVRKIKAAFNASDAFCAAASTPFDATNSIDVDVTCNKGYRWDFGDTTRPFITTNPMKPHAFAFKGPKNVRLIVTDINGCTDTARKKVIINKVSAKFTLATKPICLPGTVTLNSQSTGDTTLTKWTWTVESVGIVNGKNPTVALSKLPPANTSKKFSINLLVRDTLGCRDSVTHDLQPSIPDSTFSINQAVFCTSNPNIQFKASEKDLKAKFLWHFGDGKDSTLNNPFHVYTKAGSYTAKLNVTDSIGCRDSSVSKVTVRNHPIPGFSTNKDTLQALCYPLPITFTDTSLFSTNRSWKIGNITTNPDPSVAWTYDVRGTYPVTLTVNNDGNCPASFKRDFTIVGPAASLAITRDHICLSEGAEFIVDPKDTNDVNYFKFDFGDGNNNALKGNAPVPTKTPYNYTHRPNSGNTLVQLIVYTGKNQTGCAYTYSKTIYIDETIADFTRNNEIDTTVCLGTAMDIRNTSIDADTWAWDLGDGTKSTSKEGGPMHIFPAAKTYDVTLTASNSTKVTKCSSTKTKKVRVDPLPNAKVTGAGTICPIDPLRQLLHFLATGGKQYDWTPSAGLSAANIPNPVVNPAITTTYSVVVTDSNRCKVTLPIIAVVLQKAPEIHLDTTIVIGETVNVNLDLGKGYNYTWTPSLNLSCSNCPTPVAQPVTDQLYSLVRADTAKCYSSTSTYNFIVKPLTSIDVPSAFTPNGDQHNDKVYLRGWGIKRVIEFKIYNRWGQLVFETTDLNTGWDGYFNGELQNTETYVYHASVETWITGKTLSKKGTIDLLR
jgi:gliding motility-associated-like protein